MSICTVSSWNLLVNPLVLYARDMLYQECTQWQKKAELQKLLELSRRPKSLFYSGVWDQRIFARCAAVVGSRSMTSYGRQVLEMLIPDLVAKGYTIVSGFMYGVDHYAHQLTINHGGRTVAVLGWGITHPLEHTDQQLAEAILSTGGILLSEWKDQKGTLWTFPTRNRLIVAMSSDVYVVEAATKSGSLITARIAETLNRTVWAVPGPITSKTSQGTNMLIAEGKARPWLGIAKDTTPQTDHPLLKLLENEPHTVNELARKTKQPAADIGAQLTLLSLSGQVIERNGTYSLQ